MKISDFNKARSVADLECKDWSYGHPKNLRTDTTWQDDRYDPTVYSHPHRYDNVNFPEQEYKDVFGGTIGTAAAKEHDKHQLGLFDGNSTAMNEYKAEKKKASLKAAVAEVDELKKSD